MLRTMQAVATTNEGSVISSTTGRGDLCAMPAAELARCIAAGEVSAVEAVEAHIERIEKVNAKLNAVVVKRYDAARAEAREVDRRRAEGEALGPLAGVPVTVKECLDVTGMPSTFGLPSRAQTAATADDLYVARLRAAGAIVLGKTNVAQALLFLESDNPVYGRANNPWNVERSPGGSSGGEGAIIAAGGAPLGIGTDIGGSVRVPAAFCGIASIKPTAGRTPDAGRFSVPIGERAVVSQVGVLARRVGDVALGLEVINGGRNPDVEPPMPLGDPGAVDVSKLSIAWYAEDGAFPVSPAVRRAVLETAEILRSAGARVTAWSPPEIAAGINLYFGLLTADRGRGLGALLRGEKMDSRIALLVFMAQRSRPTLAIIGALLELLGQRRLAEGIRAFGHGDTHHYWQLVEAQMDYRARFLAALDKDGPFDLILCPPSPLPAFRHGAARDLGLPGSYTLLYNLLGLPAGVVPVTRVRADEEHGGKPTRDVVEKAAYHVEEGSAGLPVGVQVIARPWREHVALAAMGVIEAAARERPDFPNAPPA